MWKKTAAIVLALCLTLGHTAAMALDVLLIGVDRGDEGQRGRSDTMMLARIDPEAGRVRLVSFLRDLYVKIPGHGKTRLNAAYQYGGEALLKETLQNNFGVSIDRTVTVQFSHLADLVNQLGGVEVEVEERELRPINDLLKDFGAPPLEKAGRQRLNGDQALCYSRIRKLDSDFQRTSRQQTVIAAMLAGMASMSKWELLRLAIRNLGRVETDMSLQDVASLAPAIGRLDELDLRTAHVPAPGTYSEEIISGMQVLVPDPARCRRALDAFLKEE